MSSERTFGQYGIVVLVVLLMVLGLYCAGAA